jgi:hypothetical protein
VQIIIAEAATVDVPRAYYLPVDAIYDVMESDHLDDGCDRLGCERGTK